MYMITQPKALAELTADLATERAVFLVGCGTCAALLRTGGRPDVIKLAEQLAAAEKTVAGWMVIPTACDDLTADALRQQAAAIARASALVVLSCALGVQNVARYANRPVYPALNTLFFGKRDGPDQFVELCAQCGHCVLGRTAGICPMTACAKSLMNGPCGGYRDGKCEVDAARDCAWVQIYRRLEGLGRDPLPDLPPLKDYTRLSHPRKLVVPA